MELEIGETDGKRENEMYVKCGKEGDGMEMKELKGR